MAEFGQRHVVDPVVKQQFIPLPVLFLYGDAVHVVFLVQTAREPLVRPGVGVAVQRHSQSVQAQIRFVFVDVVQEFVGQCGIGFCDEAELARVASGRLWGKKMKGHEDFFLDVPAEGFQLVEGGANGVEDVVAQVHRIAFGGVVGVLGGAGDYLCSRLREAGVSGQCEQCVVVELFSHRWFYSGKL